MDRTREHLGQTDMAIIAARGIMLDAIKNLREGVDAPGVDPHTYRHIRSTQMILPNGVRWQEAAEAELLARR